MLIKILYKKKRKEKEKEQKKERLAEWLKLWSTCLGSMRPPQKKEKEKG
jgi:hypothetical protein